MLVCFTFAFDADVAKGKLVPEQGICKLLTVSHYCTRSDCAVLLPPVAAGHQGAAEPRQDSGHARVRYGVHHAAHISDAGGWLCIPALHYPAPAPRIEGDNEPLLVRDAVDFLHMHPQQSPLHASALELSQFEAVSQTLGEGLFCSRRL